MIRIFRKVVFAIEHALEDPRDTPDSIVRKWIKSRVFLALLIQSTLLALTGLSAFVFRFELDNLETPWSLAITFVGLSLAIKLPLLQIFRLNRGWWRYSGIDDVLRISRALVYGQVIIFILQSISLTTLIPRSVLILDLLMGILALAGCRFMIRLAHESKASFYLGRRENDRRILIIGAGDGGVSLLRHLRTDKRLSISAVGFVDDSLHKVGERISGIPVLGRTQDIPRLKLQYQITDVFIAIPTISRTDLRRITELCIQSKLSFKKIPSLNEIIEGGANQVELREVRVEDLLGRDPIALDKTETHQMIHGKNVFVTGAGGSIGSELCRQILQFQPKTLILIERSEYNLFKICQELKTPIHESILIPCVADICDRGGLEALFAQYKPDIVYHAAAHKHVPFMEDQPREAVRNNVFGTLNVVDLCLQSRVDRFVMISTDKAVNPSSLMGYSKRLAELIVQDRSRQSTTTMMSVRFGNVLGSSGSVVEIFRRQLAQGGPLTITHPEAKRYFMTTPEAVELVLHAGTHGRSGEIYVLEMGEAVKIVDLAERMIQLSDPEGKRKVALEFTGLRPGEKLSEEIAWDGEEFAPSGMEKVYRLRTQEIVIPLRGVLENLRDQLLKPQVDLGHLLKRAVIDIENGVRDEIAQLNQSKQV